MGYQQMRPRSITAACKQPVTYSQGPAAVVADQRHMAPYIPTRKPVGQGHFTVAIGQVDSPKFPSPRSSLAHHGYLNMLIKAIIKAIYFFHIREKNLYACGELDTLSCQDSQNGSWGRKGGGSAPHAYFPLSTNMKPPSTKLLIQTLISKSCALMSRAAAVSSPIKEGWATLNDSRHRLQVPVLLICRRVLLQNSTPFHILWSINAVPLDFARSVGRKALKSECYATTRWARASAPDARFVDITRFK